MPEDVVRRYDRVLGIAGPRQMLSSSGVEIHLVQHVEVPRRARLRIAGGGVNCENDRA